MIPWRWWVLAILCAAPFLFLIGFGAYQLWDTGWLVWAWWPLAGSIALALFLAWRWQRNSKLLRSVYAPPAHWTERDRQAMDIVERRAQESAGISADDLANLNFYVERGQRLAQELAQFYHPKAKDPIGNLTMLEILAVIELAAHDLAVLVEQYVPGSHFMKINHWRKAQTAVDWYQKASKFWWVASAFLSPVTTGARYLGSELGLNRPWQKLQENLQVWFYGAFINRLGAYLVELYSGRLQSGAARHRELLGNATLADSAAANKRPVNLLVCGQAKAGKSSLINALIGARQAETDVVQATSDITRYEVKPKGIDEELVLTDTAGYGVDGVRQDQLRATEQAARQADAILLVVHARNPGRQADQELLDKLDMFFRAHPDLKKPPILAVLTHIDLLSPSLEWAPPYDWAKPQSTKERSIAAALAYTQEQQGQHISGVVPVCTAPGKEFGIEEALVPALTALLEQARAVSLVRCLRTEAGVGKVKKSFEQLLTVGAEMLSSWWASRKQTTASP